MQQNALQRSAMVVYVMCDSFVLSAKLLCTSYHQILAALSLVVGSDAPHFYQFEYEPNTLTRVCTVRESK